MYKIPWICRVIKMSLIYASFIKKNFVEKSAFPKVSILNSMIKLSWLQKTKAFHQINDF